MNTNYDIVRVLVVEDSDIDAKRIATLLRYSAHAQYEVLTTTTLAAGIHMAEQRVVNAALVDLGLPDTDGIEAVSALVRKFPDLPILVLTGQDNFEYAIASLRAGAQDYLVKSDFSGQVLERAILYACERKAAHVRMQKFYRESMRAVVSEDVADTAELNTQFRHLRAIVETLQPKIKTVAPEVHQRLEQALREPAQSKVPNATPHRLTMPLVNDISKITGSFPAVTDVSEDPRSVLADILDKYPGSHGPSR